MPAWDVFMIWIREADCHRLASEPSHWFPSNRAYPGGITWFLINTKWFPVLLTEFWLPFTFKEGLWINKPSQKQVYSVHVYYSGWIFRFTNVLLHLCHKVNEVLQITHPFQWVQKRHPAAEETRADETNLTQIMQAARQQTVKYTSGSCEKAPVGRRLSSGENRNTAGYCYSVHHTQLSYLWSCSSRCYEN